MAEDEADSGAGDSEADEGPILDGQPIFNSKDADETRESSDKNEE
jgi:hypothetical protein